MGFLSKLFREKTSFVKSKNDDQNKEIYSQASINALRETAEEGNMTSIQLLIKIYKEGIDGVTEPNEKEEMRYMKLGADYGNCDMAYSYALYVGTSSEHGVKYMKLAADSGISDAQYFMHLFWRDSNESQKIAMASEYLQKAIHGGSVDAINLFREYGRQSNAREEEIQKAIDAIKDI